MTDEGERIPTNPTEEVGNEEIYEMYRISCDMQGCDSEKACEEAVIEVADFVHMDEYDVKDAIDAHRKAKGLKPIDWEPEE